MLAAISICHMLNDVIQSLIMAIYPMLKESLALDFGQIGLITFTFQFTASLLQPVVGYVTDRYPTPYSLVLGMSSSLTGASPHRLCLELRRGACRRRADRHGFLGVPSRNPRAWRGSHRAAATASRNRCSRSAAISARRSGRCSRPSSCFPTGSAASPGSPSLALLAMVLLAGIGAWYGKTLKLKRETHAERARGDRRGDARQGRTLDRHPDGADLLQALLSRQHHELLHLLSDPHLTGCTVQQAQLHLFIFLGAVAAGTVIGGPIGDRIGARRVIWWSILGVLPFTLALPYVGLSGTAILSVIIGADPRLGLSGDPRLCARA